MSDVTNMPSDFQSLFELVRIKAKISGPIRAVLVVPSDLDMLIAFDQARADDLLVPSIIGDEELLKKKASKTGIDLQNYHIIDINEPELALKTALKMAVKDEVDLIVKGRLTNDEVVASILAEKSEFLDANKQLSHISFFKAASYERLLIIADGGVIARPDLDQKIRIISNVVDFCDCFGLKKPKIAPLAAVEVVYPQMEVTVEAEQLTKLYQEGQIKGAIVDGPLSMDVALDPIAAAGKGKSDSEVAGKVDVLLAPDIQTAKGMYSAISLFIDAEIGGILFGGRVPIAVSSASDTPKAKLNSILLALLASK